MMTKRLGVFALTVALGALCSTLRLSADPPSGGARAAPEASPADKHRVSVEVARDRAELMHDLFADALEVVHHRYFRRDGAVLPARALEDVFARVEGRSGVKARWIAVNT